MSTRRSLLFLAAVALTTIVLAYVILELSIWLVDSCTALGAPAP